MVAVTVAAPPGSGDMVKITVTPGDTFSGIGIPGIPNDVTPPTRTTPK